MDNIGKKLEEILEDPGKMKQIMDIAASMGLPGQIAEQLPQELPQDLMQQISGMLQQTETKDKQQQNLIRALLPYLNPRRQVKLERAMQLSHISRLAGAAMRSSTVSNPSPKEGDIHV